MPLIKKKNSDILFWEMKTKETEEKLEEYENAYFSGGFSDEQREAIKKMLKKAN